MKEPWRPSEEERLLLSTSDEEIIERHKTFSFNYEDLKSRVRSGDHWQQIIQAHLYFEHVVGQILLEELPNPEAISLSRIGFSQRLDLIVAMALLPEELVRPIRKISSLRNAIAHDLEFSVSNEDIQDLKNCTPLQLRDAVVRQPGRNEGQIQLDELLLVILLKADILRQNKAASRELNRKSELRLRAVLQKNVDVKYVP